MWKKHCLTLGVVFVFIGFLMLVNSLKITGLSISEFTTNFAGKILGVVFILAGIAVVFSSRKEEQ
jgi:hypothetical protein